MKTGKRWSCWKASLAALLLASAGGCATDRLAVEKNLLAAQSVQRQEGVTERYRVGCPDVIEVEVAQRPEFAGRYQIAADGKIDLGDYGNPRIEGRTVEEVAHLLADEVGTPPEGVLVRVADFRNAHVLLFGEVAGRQRSIPYRGQETVLDLLQRVGGITVGAAPSDVYVVRPHLGDSQRPEVFHVDLHAIVVKHDYKTNLRILPFDQIYVGETRQAQVERALPSWLRWASQAIWDTRPDPQTNQRREQSLPSRWVEGKKE